MIGFGGFLKNFRDSVYYNNTPIGIQYDGKSLLINIDIDKALNSKRHSGTCTSTQSPQTNPFQKPTVLYSSLCLKVGHLFINV